MLIRLSNRRAMEQMGGLHRKFCLHLGVFKYMKLKFWMFLIPIVLDQSFLCGWDCVRLEYTVKWPLHIIFQESTLEK